MYRVSLKDVGQDRVTKDVTAHVGTLLEAEFFADSLCCGILDGVDFAFRTCGDNEYGIEDGDIKYGSFTITKLS